MDYIELFCSIKPPNSLISEILIARLANIGYESFMDHENGFFAYIPLPDFDESLLNNLTFPDDDTFSVSFKHKLIQQKNWNSEWEKNFNPVVIAKRCMVRAPFHEKDNSMEYDIIIEPKMSFGTAHHETTQLMIRILLNENVAGKNILDMGCGTGVLAILSKKLGANEVTAIDNDKWAYDNALSNIAKNNCSDINVQLGDRSSLKNKKYDMILANINRNILLNDIHAYVDALNRPGTILISGFYEDDLEVIIKKAATLSLEIRHYEIMNKWTAALFSKQQY